MRQARVLIFLMLAVTAAAQTSAVNGGIEGTIADPSGARIPGATVVAREISTHLTREATSNAEGIYRVLELPPGTYALSIAYPGFARYDHGGIVVPLGAMVHQDIALAVVGSEAITVTAQPPALDPAQTSVATSIDTERIEELPVQSRNYLNFVLLAPGVAPSTQQFDSGFSFGGLRGRSNNVTIDGLDNNDEFLGASRTELSLETVQEFQVVNSGLSAETGGASGGSINVITRVGANAIHGDAFVFLQNGAFDARQPFETEHAAPLLHRYRIGLALGGPIVKDKTFYYAAFEQEHNRALDDAFIPRLPGLPLRDDFFPTARAETEASAKLNHQLTQRNSLMLRYAYTNNREAGDAFHNDGWFDASARGSSFTRDNAIAGALTTVFDPNTVGDFRAQYATRDAVTRTNNTTGPGVYIAGIAIFGRPYDGNGARTETHHQASYIVSRAAGRHLLKAGVTYNRVREDASILDGAGGIFAYATVADYLAARPIETRRAFGNPAAAYAVQNYGAFIQDHWTLAQGLTLDLGVRYDYEHLPAPLPRDGNNVSPRAGLAWQLSKTWVARAGYGIFYDRYLLAALNPILQNKVEQVDAVPFVYRSAAALPASYSSQANVAVEHLIAKDLTASVSLMDVAGIHLARTLALPGSYQLDNSSHSNYRGASFTLNRRMFDELEFTAAYTLSKTYDDASDFTEIQPQRAFSRQDQRHRLTFNALWELPIADEKPQQDKSKLEKALSNLELAPIFTLESGSPLDALTGNWPYALRAPGFHRNSGRGPMQVNTDLRLLKYFAFTKTAHLDLVAEAFNLFNRANVLRLNPVVGPYFLQPLAGSGARQIQFSLDYEF